MIKEKTSREISLDILESILEKHIYSHKALSMANEKYAYLKKEERVFISRLIHGTLEYLIQIDYIISMYSKINIKKIRPLIKNILRLAVYQIFYMDRVPDSAVCNEALKLVEKRGFKGLKAFVNGVLRNIVRNKENISFKDLSLKYSMDKFIIDILKNSIDDADIEKVLQSFLKENFVSLKINSSKISVEDAVKKLRKDNIEVEYSFISKDIIKLKNFDRLSEVSLLKEKLAYVQDASSALAIECLGIKENSIVFDIAAAPGGKSLSALDKLKGTGFLYSFDISDTKIRLIEENLKNYSFYNNYKIDIKDASIYNEEYLEKADYIIADVPCSCIGIIGKKPDIKMNINENMIKELSNLQFLILNNVSKYLKKGGKILYSTCTINKDENIKNVNEFLKSNKDFSLCDFSEYVNDTLKKEAKNGYIQLLPGIHDCDGFFISILKKE